ncbi:MAG: PQQ-dependent sugar dehydrogenase, partial [Steroidobacteraceae bacterium]
IELPMMRSSTFRALAGCAAITVVVACGGGGYSSGSTPPPIPAPNPPPSSNVTLAVEQVFSNLSFSSPVAMLQAPGEATRWFVVEQAGVVRVFDNVANVTVSTTFVNITSRVLSGGELGLLGMAFHPGWAPANRRVYLSYTNGASGRVSLISEFQADAAGTTLDPASERILLVINQPEANHNGGGIAFGPDGFLYIGMGDGGGGGDLHGAIGNGQNNMTLLGKILRIDVAPAVGYAIPAGNAFPSTNTQCGLNGSGTQNCPEIFAVGFRNPWRWSFDRTTRELWVADVGQNLWEEANRVTVGGNYGWRCREGAHSFNTNCGGAQNLIDPVVEYGHSVGFSITGGYVYRGATFPTLQGRYVFGDFGGRIWNIARDTAPTLDVTNTTAPVLATGLSISSFAEGNDGELYVVHHGGTLHRLRVP